LDGTQAAAAPLGEARLGHTATRLDDGRVLVAGGYGNSGVEASVEIFDPLANAFTSAPPLDVARTVGSRAPRADQRAQGRSWTEIAEQAGGAPDALRMQLLRAIDRVSRELRLEE